MTAKDAPQKWRITVDDTSSLRASVVSCQRLKLATHYSSTHPPTSNKHTQSGHWCALRLDLKETRQAKPNVHPRDLKKMRAVGAVRNLNTMPGEDAKPLQSRNNIDFMGGGAAGGDSREGGGGCSQFAPEPELTQSRQDLLVPPAVDIGLRGEPSTAPACPSKAPLTLGLAPGGVHTFIAANQAIRDENYDGTHSSTERLL
jgi:hypothetical protein